MLLAYHLSQINKDDIVLYNLDTLNTSRSLNSAGGGSVSGSARSTGHIVRLHASLQRHLEETTMRLLAECAELEVVEIDTNRIARDLELFCVDRSNVSLRRLKGLLYAGMQSFERLPASLQLLLHLKDGGGPIRMRTSPMLRDELGEDSLPPSPLSQHSPPTATAASPAPSQPIEVAPSSDGSSGYASPETIDSDPALSPAAGVQAEDPVASRVVTDRFEFAEIDEADLVSDLLFVLQGIEGRFIKRGAHGRFILTSSRKVSRGVRQLTERICSLGEVYNRIVDAKMPPGLISQALYQGVMDEVHQYNRLVNMLVSSRSTEPLSLRRLYVWVQQPYARMRLLHSALGLPQGFTIDGIFDLYCGRGDTMGRELYCELLRKCMVPYLELLLHWVYFGELEDACGVFFVRRVQGHYRLAPSKVPKFMPRSLAELCFEVGCCGSYYSQLKNGRPLKASVDIPGVLRQLCPEGQPWSVFVTVQRLCTLVRSVDTGAVLLQELVGKHDLCGYLRRVKGHLAMEHLGSDPSAPEFDDFECNAEYGFDIYVPKFSFPLALILEDEKEAREAYIISFRLEFVLQRALKILSISWSEYAWHSRCSHGSLELSRRLSWINLCRNEMSHFANVLQGSRSVQYVLDQLIRRVSSRDYPYGGATLADLRSSFSDVLACFRASNFLEIMDILESIVDFCKLVPRLFNRGSMQQLRSLVREGASPADITHFIHQNIATDDLMKVMSRYAERFRESVLLLLHRLSCQDSERRRFAAIMDYNNFYRLLSVIEQ
ncbi:hypothetical protein, conserved [Babesia bigemina]|uniref:Gamma tubulin complex component protein N-terminal domain-containing protein n=1 Tax=Babesia bigemina TaxID=5866 RepID=A0A061DDZ0_BABBI|nr:hypothetical protein, conserved [Babesia bigemina]CDR97794.1 hypothetical protein, conserved [Babesia bigemina]|eukprot:XP_012769980.1 hypothetical protein, conserved [Babesia bigemina]